MNDTDVLVSAFPGKMKNLSVRIQKARRAGNAGVMTEIFYRSV